MSSSPTGTVGGLIGFEDFKKALNFLTFRSISKGGIMTIGAVSGLMVIRHAYSSSKPSIVTIDNYAKEITNIAGRDFADIPINVIWEGTGATTILKFENTYSYANSSFNIVFLNTLL